MSAIDAPVTAAAVAPKEGSASPLLFVFMLPMLAIVGMVLWIGQSPTWLLVGATMATIALTTGLVMVAINKLLSDGDGAGNPDVFEH